MGLGVTFQLILAGKLFVALFTGELFGFFVLFQVLLFRKGRCEFFSTKTGIVLFNEDFTYRFQGSEMLNARTKSVWGYYILDRYGKTTFKLHKRVQLGHTVEWKLLVMGKNWKVQQFFLFYSIGFTILQISHTSRNIDVFCCHLSFSSVRDTSTQSGGIFQYTKLFRCLQIVDFTYKTIDEFTTKHPWTFRKKVIFREVVSDLFHEFIQYIN